MASGNPHRRPGAVRRAAALALAALALAACGSPAGVLPRGGYGRSTFLLWQEPGREPLVMQADRFQQLDNLFQRMHFEDVLVRCPSPDAVLYVRAQDADVRGSDNAGTGGSAQPPGGHSAAVLDGVPGNADDEADARADLATIYSKDPNGGRLEDGVHLAGSENGVPVVGVASLVRVRPNDHAVLCEHLHLSSGVGAPALAAALGALPHPLVLPEIKGD